MNVVVVAALMPIEESIGERSKSAWLCGLLMTLYDVMVLSRVFVVLIACVLRVVAYDVFVALAPIEEATCVMPRWKDGMGVSER